MGNRIPINEEQFLSGRHGDRLVANGRLAVSLVGMPYVVDPARQAFPPPIH